MSKFFKIPAAKHFFPRFSTATCICGEIWLVHLNVRLCCDWSILLRLCYHFRYWQSWKANFLPICGHCSCNKSVRLTSFHKSHCNPFQSSSSLSIRLSFCVCCVIYTFFSSFELFFFVSLSLVEERTVWIVDKSCYTAPLSCLLLPITAMAVPL